MLWLKNWPTTCAWSKKGTCADAKKPPSSHHQKPPTTKPQLMTSEESMTTHPLKKKLVPPMPQQKLPAPIPHQHSKPLPQYQKLTDAAVTLLFPLLMTAT